MELLESATGNGHHAEEVKRLALELYSTRANRNMPETIRLLNGLVTHPIPEKTVYWWRSQYGWDRQLDLQSAERQRELINLHVAGLRVAAPDAVKYLHDVVTDKAEPHPQKIAAARTLIGENRSLMVAAVKAGILEPGTRQDDWSIPADISDEDLLALAMQGCDAGWAKS